MDNRPYLTKTLFAISLGMSIRTLQRRAQDINFTFSKGMISPFEQDKFKEKLEEWERNGRSRND